MTDFVFTQDDDTAELSATDLASYSVGVQPEVTPEEEEAFNKMGAIE